MTGDKTTDNTGAPSTRKIPAKLLAHILAHIRELLENPPPEVVKRIADRLRELRGSDNSTYLTGRRCG